MPRRSSLRVIASAAVLSFSMSLGVAAADGAKYPDWQAQWKNASGGHFNAAGSLRGFYSAEDGGRISLFRKML